LVENSVYDFTGYESFFDFFKGQEDDQNSMEVGNVGSMEIIINSGGDPSNSGKDSFLT
jgi:hypothetical protein